MAHHRFPLPLLPSRSLARPPRAVSAAAMQNSRAGINREVPAHFETLNLDRGESTRVCDSSRPGGTGLGPRVPCVLEEEEGVTLLAPEVKLWGLAPDQQLAQINEGLSEPLWAPESCGQGSALQTEVRTEKLRSDLSWAQVSPFRRRWGGDIPPRARVWQRPGSDTAPREGRGGSGSPISSWLGVRAL